jgi:hypothetical protein
VQRDTTHHKPVDNDREVKGRTMKNLTIATTAAAGLSAALVGLAAPALASPSSDGDAQHTISRLEAMGNRVIVNRLSTTPLSMADVVAVRSGPEIMEWVWGDGGQRHGDHQREDRVLETVGRIFYVDIR